MHASVRGEGRLSFLDNREGVSVNQRNRLTGASNVLIEDLSLIAIITENGVVHATFI